MPSHESLGKFKILTLTTKILCKLVLPTSLALLSVTFPTADSCPVPASIAFEQAQLSINTGLYRILQMWLPSWFFSLGFLLILQVLGYFICQVPLFSALTAPDSSEFPVIIIFVHDLHPLVAWKRQETSFSFTVLFLSSSTVDGTEQELTK